MVRALIRGWFIARFLGLLDVDQADGTSVARFTRGPGGLSVESPPLVNVPGKNKPRQLGSFLETLALAIPYAADAGKAEEFLAIYAELIDVGRTSGTAGSEVGEFRELSPILEEWVSSATAFGQTVTVLPDLQRDESAERANALAELVLKVDRDYEKHADGEREGGRIGPENAWLGISDLIHEELHRMATALQARASQTTPEF